MREKLISRRSILAGIPAGAALVGLGLASTAKAGDNQPHMETALKALQTALDELQAAEQDKGGHRVKAMEHVRMAIAEVQRGINFDNRHPG